MKRFILLISLLVAAGTQAAQVIPAQPTEFETVNVRMLTDSCTFVPSTVRVSSAASVIRVTQQLNACLVPGEPRVVDVRLGAFPAGDYAVEIYVTPQPTGTPVERLSFRVEDRRAEVLIFPPPPRPLADHSGVWWSPSESGWGLFLHQSPYSNIMFGAWFVYGAGNRPDWYTLQDGRWTSFATWTATVFRTSGPPLTGPFDPRLVTIAPVGTATIDFTQSPGSEGRAQFRYNVDGIATTKTIQRLLY